MGPILCISKMCSGRGMYSGNDGRAGGGCRFAPGSRKSCSIPTMRTGWGRQSSTCWIMRSNIPSQGQAVRSCRTRTEAKERTHCPARVRWKEQRSCRMRSETKERTHCLARVRWKERRSCWVRSKMKCSCGSGSATTGPASRRVTRPGYSSAFTGAAMQGKQKALGWGCI